MTFPRPSMRLLHTHFLPGLPRAAQWTFGVALVLLALGAPHTLYPRPWAQTAALYAGACGLILLLLATARVSRHLRETEALQKRTEVARQRFARVVEQTSEIVFITARKICRCLNVPTPAGAESLLPCAGAAQA